MIRLTALILFLAISHSGVAQDLGVADLETASQRQQLASSELHRLVDNTLTQQIRLLEENGLATDSRFLELSAMRQAFATTIAGQMTDLQSSLDKYHRDPNANAVDNIGQQTRKIASLLIAERQRLVRRLKSHRLDTDLRNLIMRQNGALTTLQQAAETGTAVAIADSLEQQRSVRLLYFQLLDTLESAVGWDVTTQDAAARLVEFIHAGDLNARFQAVQQALEQAATADAIGHEGAILTDLRRALEILVETNINEHDNNQQAVDAVERLIDSQQRLISQTRRARNAPENYEPLVDEQLELAGDIRGVGALVAGTTENQQHLQSASDGAQQAGTHLFAEEGSLAIEQQNIAVDQLRLLATEFRSKQGKGVFGASADELANQIAAIEQTVRRLSGIARDHRQIEAAYSYQVLVAVQQQLDGLDIAWLPKSITHDIEQTAQWLGTADSAGNLSATRSLVQARLEAISGRAAVLLWQTRRRFLAVKAGELARAAEAMERAIAAEFELSTGEVDLIDWQRRQSLVGEVIQEVAAGTALTATEASHLLSTLTKQAEVAAKLETKEAPYATTARRLAEKLGPATDSLRDRVIGSADELIAHIDDAVAQSEMNSKSLRSLLSPITQLSPEIDLLEKRLNANGRPTPEHELTRLLADHAALVLDVRSLAAGHTHGPLGVATRLRELGDRLDLLASNAAAPIADSLRKAAIRAGRLGDKLLGSIEIPTLQAIMAIDVDMQAFRGAIDEQANTDAQAITSRLSDLFSPLVENAEAQSDSLETASSPQLMRATAMLLASVDAIESPTGETSAWRLVRLFPTIRAALQDAINQQSAVNGQLLQLQATARQLAGSAQVQQSSRAKLVAAAKRLMQLAAETTQIEAETRTSAAGQLADAQQTFADALTTTGKAAAELSGQSVVANEHIRAALRAASLLSREESATKKTGTTNQGPKDGNTTPNATGGSGDNANEASDATADENATGEDDSQQQPGDLGEDLVPQSPDATADVIAGEQAMAEAAAATSGESPSDSASGDSAQGQNLSPSQANNSTESDGSGSGGGSASGKRPTGAGKPENTATSKGATGADNTDPRSLEDASWFAKLPPGVQQAIRAKTRQQLPRGYEQRLKRYFRQLP